MTRWFLIVSEITFFDPFTVRRPSSSLSLLVSLYSATPLSSFPSPNDSSLSLYSYNKPLYFYLLLSLVNFLNFVQQRSLSVPPHKHTPPRHGPLEKGHTRRVSRVTTCVSGVCLFTECLLCTYVSQELKI